MNISDVMIHINESLGEAARTSLEDTLRKVEGLVSPKFGAGPTSGVGPASEVHRRMRCSHEQADQLLDAHSAATESHSSGGSRPCDTGFGAD